MAIRPDTPIASLKEDSLKRGPYAKAIADRILAYEPADSVVLGLIGKWGKAACGKSASSSATTPPRAFWS
jgi:predicted KAP-like P-loop ATPase